MFYYMPFFYPFTFNSSQLPFSLYLILITHWQHRVRACYLIQTEICLLIGVYSPFTLNVIIDVIGFKSTFSVFIFYFLYLLFFFCFTFLNFYVNSIMFDLVLQYNILFPLLPIILVRLYNIILQIIIYFSFYIPKFTYWLYHLGILDRNLHSWTFLLAHLQLETSLFLPPQIF